MGKGGRDRLGSYDAEQDGVTCCLASRFENLAPSNFWMLGWTRYWRKRERWDSVLSVKKRDIYETLTVVENTGSWRDDDEALRGF